MRITRETSLVDFCFVVCTALHNAGTECVLVGGSAATYYAPKAYQSHDADFVIMRSADGKRASSALSDLGFNEASLGLYRHPSSAFTLEFPAGPLGIGDDLIASWDTVEHDGMRLNIYSRTDSVRDRLASFYYFSDRSALAAAVAVAKSGQVDLTRIEEWSVREGQVNGFGEFRELLRDEDDA